jgi:hypothetical protein
MERIDQSTSTERKVIRIHVLESFSTFPELRTRVKAETEREVAVVPESGGKVSDCTA